MTGAPRKEGPRVLSGEALRVLCPDHNGRVRQALIIMAGCDKRVADAFLPVGFDAGIEKSISAECPRASF